jgi:hypothetical protein
MLEEPVEDRVASSKSIGEEEPRPREDQDGPESEEEQRSSVLFTQEQLEVLLKRGRPDFGELVATLKMRVSKGERFQPAKPGNFDGACDHKVVDAWLAEMDDYIHAVKVGRHSAVELAQSYSDVGRSDKSGFKKDNKFFHKKPSMRRNGTGGKVAQPRISPNNSKARGSNQKGTL